MEKATLSSKMIGASDPICLKVEGGLRVLGLIIHSPGLKQAQQASGGSKVVVREKEIVLFLLLLKPSL